MSAKKKVKKRPVRLSKNDKIMTVLRSKFNPCRMGLKWLLESKGLYHAAARATGSRGRMEANFVQWLLHCMLFDFQGNQNTIGCLAGNADVLLLRSWNRLTKCGHSFEGMSGFLERMENVYGSMGSMGSMFHTHLEIMRKIASACDRHNLAQDLMLLDPIVLLGAPGLVAAVESDLLSMYSTDMKPYRWEKLTPPKRKTGIR